MNVARLELCKELYGLSRWEDTEKWWSELVTGNAYALCAKDKLQAMNTWIKEGEVVPDCQNAVPAYDLGYLLQKLPHDGINDLHGLSNDWPLTIEYGHTLFGEDLVKVGYCNNLLEENNKWSFIGEAQTPEDAAAKLAIQLFKQGTLTKQPN